MAEKSGKGEHRPQKSVQEILRGFQYDVFLKTGFGYLWGRQGEVDGKRLGEPSGVATIGPKD